MPGNLTFKVGDIRKLYEHSKASLSRAPGFPMQLPDADNVDHNLVPAGLLLVGDTGVYLMSNGEPGLFADITSGLHHVVYAGGCDPRILNEYWEENKRAVFGCDDNSIYLSLDMFDKAMQLPDDTSFNIKVTHSHVEVVCPKTRARPIQLRAGMSFVFKNPAKLKNGQIVNDFSLVAVDKQCRATFVGDNKKEIYFLIDSKYIKSLIRSGGLEKIEKSGDSDSPPACSIRQKCK